MGYRISDIYFYRGLPYPIPRSNQTKTKKNTKEIQDDNKKEG